MVHPIIELQTLILTHRSWKLGGVCTAHCCRCGGRKIGNFQRFSLCRLGGSKGRWIYRGRGDRQRRWRSHRRSRYVGLGFIFFFWYVLHVQNLCELRERPIPLFDLVSLAFLCYFLFWEERNVKFEQKYLFTPDFNRDGLRKTNETYLKWVKWHFLNHGYAKWFRTKPQVGLV